MLLSDRKKTIIKLSMNYINLEGEILPIKDTLNHIKKIKKAIKSIEQPIV